MWSKGGATHEERGKADSDRGRLKAWIAATTAAKECEALPGIVEVFTTEMAKSGEEMCEIKVEFKKAGRARLTKSKANCLHHLEAAGWPTHIPDGGLKYSDFVAEADKTWRNYKAGD